MSGICVSALFVGGSVSAQTAQSGQSSSGGYALAGQSMAASGGLGSASGVDHAMMAGDWVLSPEVFAGAVYNDNIGNSAVNKRSGWGFRLRPSLDAVRDTGIQKTVVHADGDLQLYPNSGNVAGGNNGNIVNGRLALIHVYEVERDLVLRYEGSVSRSNDVFNNGLAAGGGATLLSQNTTTLYSALTGQKSFGNLFVGLGVSAQRVIYSDLTPGTNQNYNQFSILTRIGYRVGPDIYVFLDPSLNWRNPDAVAQDSHGYRVVGGIGTDRFSLFSGEVYAGYSGQNYDNALIRDASTGVFGAKLNWTPTQDILVTGQLDRQLGDSAVTGIAAPIVSTKTTTASLTGNYRYNNYITLKSRFGFSRSTYDLSARVDSRWQAVLGVSYTFWRNWALTAEYQFNSLNSNVANASYNQNLVSLGATYKY